MSALVWSDHYSVGVKQFDAQHQQLFRLVNELFAAMQAGQGNDVLQGILFGLVRYTKDHFAAEEKVMDSLHYAGLKQHIDEHRKLTEQVEKFTQDFKAGKQTLSISVLNFLKHWLVDHIGTCDHKYSAHLISKGMS